MKGVRPSWAMDCKQIQTWLHISLEVGLIRLVEEEVRRHLLILVASKVGLNG